MDIGKTLYVSTRSAWRAWLKKHHQAAREIWLVYYKKDSGKPRIPYDDAVEEALCYGWIDSTVKTIDRNRFAQRFSPRKSTSVLSQPNKERIRELIRRGKMTKAGLRALVHVYNPATDRPERFVVPSEIVSALKANPQAWRHYRGFPDSYKRVRVAFILDRKRHGQGAYRKALQNFINKTAQGKRFGFVGVGKQ